MGGLQQKEKRSAQDPQIVARTRDNPVPDVFPCSQVPSIFKNRVIFKRDLLESSDISKYVQNYISDINGYNENKNGKGKGNSI